jgi:plasmid stabilization system protein ParE
LEKYREISDALAEDFFEEFETGLMEVAENPQVFHFDASGLRRCNFDRFPYHFLYDIRDEYVRVWVVRHDRRNPKFGMQRF